MPQPARSARRSAASELPFLRHACRAATVGHPLLARLSRIYLLLALCVFALAVARFFTFTADDAFITARYAENLIERGELVFQAGERVSAMTSPLHALVEAALYAATGATILANKIVSIALVLATSAALLWRARASGRAQALLATVLLLSPCVAVWSVGGLETPLLFAVVGALA